MQHAGAGGGSPGDQQENTSTNDGVMRRRGAGRLSVEEYPVATCNIFESPISKKLCSVAQVDDIFGVGNTHTSEGQLSDEPYNSKYKEEMNCTPKR